MFNLRRADAVPGNTLDNPIYDSAAMGESSEHAPAHPQEMDPRTPSPSANFDDPIYMMSIKQLETTQQQPQSGHLQSNVYASVQKVPTQKDKANTPGIQSDNSKIVTEFQDPRDGSSSPDACFHNVLYEATDTSAVSALHKSTNNPSLPSPISS